MWMNEVAASWMMTSLTSVPIWVALVQTASTLPVFLLGIPSGALADILDRRRYFIATQFWLAGVALLLCAVVLADAMTPALLLVLTFANGVGLAMRWPVFAAIVPELVPRRELPAALALNGVSMNASRIIGPLLAGMLIANAGIVYAFALNAILSLVSGVVLLRWRHVHKPSPLGRERLLTAMRVGLQFVRHSRRLKAVLFRVSVFFFHSTALLALLPLVARTLGGNNASSFTLMLASMGIGAIVGAIYLPRLRIVMPADAIVAAGAALQSVATGAIAFADSAWLAYPLMALAGAAWISTVNALSVSAQLALPDWVRARGMSIYQMSIMGASALGAALWGQVATISSLTVCLCAAAASGVLSMLIVQFLVPGGAAEDDLTPSDVSKPSIAGAPPSTSNVLVMIEYQIDPAQADDFLAVMQESRLRRLQQGVLRWELTRDVSHPGRYLEQIVDESWTEYLRRYDRFTASDVALRERKLAFHVGTAPPVMSHFAIEG